MSDGLNTPGRLDLRQIAAATALVIAMLAAAGLAYLLVDILLLLFMGIVVAAALQPWHLVLCRWGIPKGLAVLLIYLLLFLGLVLVGLVVGPVLIDQVGTFLAELPSTYANTRIYLRESSSAPFHFLGLRMPPFESLAQHLPEIAPQLYRDTLGITATIVELPVYFVTVLAIAYNWTMEVPRIERLLLSLIAVEQRPRALNVWHEIESKLGGSIRGQGLVMLTVGLASAVGYALLGLPNVAVLAVLAGLLEAIPVIGPVLAAGPAVLVALPLGLNTVLSVVGLAVVLQLIESNVLIPRIMHRTVGVSALFGLLAILVFGTLYGILGVLIAIPMAAVIQVLLDTLVVNAEAVAEPAGLAVNPWDDLRSRVRALRQQARVRLRARTSRMGIDPATADHVVDAVDEQIEVAVARAERLISVAEETSQPLGNALQAAIVEKLQVATEQLEQAVERVDTITAPADAALETTDAATELAWLEVDQTARQAEEQLVEDPESTPGRMNEPDGIVDNLDKATQRFKNAVQDIETLVTAAQEESNAAADDQPGRPPR